MKHLYILAFVAACGSSNSSISRSGPTPAGQVAAAEVSLVEMINTHRQTLGLAPVELAQALDDEMQKHTDDMAASRIKFGHEGFSNRCLSARTDLGGGNACGEIVARGQKTPQAAFTAWLNSAGHKARMEDSRYNRVGVGISADDNGKLYWGMLFLQR